jgi:hypothetical protein
MKTLAIVLLAVSLPVASIAVIDPDPDLIGIYFDTQADINCLQVDPGSSFSAYVILTNPSVGSIDAFEFGYENEFDSDFYGMLALLGAILPPQSVNVGSGDANSGDVIVGMASPLPPATALVLLTWEYMALDKFPVMMYLGPSSTPSLPGGLPVVQEAGGDLMTVDILTGSANKPVAAVNSVCGSKEGLAWGSLKSTFR